MWLVPLPGSRRPGGIRPKGVSSGASPRGHLNGVKHGACRRTLVITLVCVELHVAFGQLALVPINGDIGHIKDIRIGSWDLRAWCLQLAKAGDQPALVVGIDVLCMEYQHLRLSDSVTRSNGRGFRYTQGCRYI